MLSFPNRGIFAPGATPSLISKQVPLLLSTAYSLSSMSPQPPYNETHDCCGDHYDDMMMMLDDNNAS
jgi:hypothetical protein